jgi:FtsZ-binding cell division protein ZapB
MSLVTPMFGGHTSPAPRLNRAEAIELRDTRERLKALTAEVAALKSRIMRLSGDREALKVASDNQGARIQSLLGQNKSLQYSGALGTNLGAMARDLASKRAT